MLVEDLQDRSKLKMMGALRRFITVDRHESVKIGDLEKALGSRSVVKPKFTSDFPERVVREGGDELALRREEEGMLRFFIDNTKASGERNGRTCITSM